ncbi:unnamed protein product [Adineta steineri]|uniref:Uncharacterized protein n=1 Tax=Adineta steineri TaxID=433720 RepID=A0A814JLI1_9BILA|nr:unnamed protein product [Adineta steineri]CAF0824620.1 unnamed protein product [Adineta steineri]CAF1039650.1 unnamed protein product [Adineta steineri]
MENENETLRPYPIDPSQDKVIKKIVFAKRKLKPQLTSFLFTILTYSLKLLSKYKNKKLTEKNKRNSSNIYINLNFYNGFNILLYCSLCDNGFIDQSQTPLVSISVDGDNILAVDKNQIIHCAKSNRIICKVSFDCPKWQIIESRVK